VDISTAEEYFDEGDTVSLETLKEKGLVLPAATVLKLYASGDMTKRLVVEAHHFTLDAIKAISDADGDTVMIR
jgi:ribosomal protein L15